MSVANYSASIVARRLQILADGSPVTARDLVLEPLSRADVVIDELPRRRARRRGAASTPADDADEGSGPADFLPLDDAAWAIVPPDRLRRVLLVGPGNVYLQNAFALLPNVELYGATAEEYADDHRQGAVRPGRLRRLPAARAAAQADPRLRAAADERRWAMVTGTLDEFGMGQPAVDDPLLRGVDLTRLHIAETQSDRSLPAWARPVIPGVRRPAALRRPARRPADAVFAFDLRQSDLPLQVAWPIMVSNLAGELLGVGPQQALDPLRAVVAGRAPASRPTRRACA